MEEGSLMAWARLLNGSNRESPSPQSSPVKGPARERRQEGRRGRVRPSIRAGEAPALLGVNGLRYLTYRRWLGGLGTSTSNR